MYDRDLGMRTLTLTLDESLIIGQGAPANRPAIVGDASSTMHHAGGRLESSRTSASCWAVFSRSYDARMHVPLLLASATAHLTIQLIMNGRCPRCHSVRAPAFYCGGRGPHLPTCPSTREQRYSNVLGPSPRALGTARSPVSPLLAHQSSADPRTHARSSDLSRASRLSFADSSGQPCASGHTHATCNAYA